MSEKLVYLAGPITGLSYDGAVNWRDMNLVGAERVSIGTMIEAGWADAFRKPVVLAIEEGNMHHHAMLEHISGWIVSDLDQAIDVTKALLA